MAWLKKYLNQTGQSLIEITLAIGLATLLVPVIYMGVISAREGTAQEAQRLQAVSLVREAVEAVRSVREKSWNSFASLSGDYYPSVVGSQWSLTPGSEQVGLFTRTVNLASVYRDSNGEIFDQPGSGRNLDPSTKKVTVEVSWSMPIPSSINSIIYLTRYLDNASFTETLQSEFDVGTKTDVVTTATDPDGEVRLERLSPGKSN